MLEYHDKVVQDVAACTCDRCQRRMTPEDHPDWEEKLSVAFSTGYDSIFGDRNEVEIDLCPQCVKETLGAWLRFSQSDWAAAIERGVTDSDAGRGKPADEVFDRLDAKYSDAARAAAQRLADLGGSQPGIKGAPRKRR